MKSWKTFLDCDAISLLEKSGIQTWYVTEKTCGWAFLPPSPKIQTWPGSPWQYLYRAAWHMSIDTPVVRRSWVMHVLCSHVLWLPSIDQETTYSLTQADNNIIQRPTQLSFKHAVAVHYLWIYASVPTVIASVLVLMQHKHSAQPVTFPMPDQYLVVLLPATGLEKKARTVNA